MHGPTFMANALACAVAVASVELLLSQDWRTRVGEISAGLSDGLEAARSLPAVADVRVLRAIGVIETHQPVDLRTATPVALDHGVWLRPFRNLITPCRRSSVPARRSHRSPRRWWRSPRASTGNRLAVMTPRPTRPRWPGWTMWNSSAAGPGCAGR